MFLNDYNDSAHERVLMDLLKLDKGYKGYGKDEISIEAAELIKRDLKCECDIHFVPGGTIANVLVINAALRPYEAVIAPVTGHIEGHEAGSIEALGNKILTMDTEDGKINPETLREFAEKFTEDYQVRPKVVYISNTTELGTYYDREELREIYKVCREKNLYLYIDGARMAVAMAKAQIKPEEMQNLCDVFTFGGTKNGALYGEAVVIFNDDLKENFRLVMKQRGAMQAKGFILGSQFKTLFEDGLYYELGKKSLKMAEYMVQGLKESGVKFNEPPLTNQIFIELPKNVAEELYDKFAFEVQEELEDKKVIRLVTNYRTTKEEIDEFVEELKKYNLSAENREGNFVPLYYEYDKIRITSIAAALRKAGIPYDLSTEASPNVLGIYAGEGRGNFYPTRVSVEEERYDEASAILSQLFGRA